MLEYSSVQLTFEWNHKISFVCSRHKNQNKINEVAEIGKLSSDSSALGKKRKTISINYVKNNLALEKKIKDFSIGSQHFSIDSRLKKDWRFSEICCWKVSEDFAKNFFKTFQPFKSSSSFHEKPRNS